MDRDANGLDKLLARLGATSDAPFERKIGLSLVDAGRGRVLFSAVADADNANASGAMHGGWIAGLFDAVTGAAVATILGAEETYATISLHVSYLRGVQAGMKVEVAGEVIAEGGRIVTSRATASCNAKELARAEATCMRLPAGPA